jgi:PIN like domain
MIKVLVDENLSEHLADGLNAIQRPMDNGIEVVSMKNIFGKETKMKTGYQSGVKWMEYF